MANRRNRQGSDAAFLFLFLGTGLGIVTLLSFSLIAVPVGVVSLVILCIFSGSLFLWSRGAGEPDPEVLPEEHAPPVIRAIAGDNRPSLLRSPLLQIFEQLTDVYLVVDESLDILYANDAASSFFGQRKPGQKLTSLIRHPSVLEGVEQALKQGEARSEEIFLPVPVERNVAFRVAAVQPEATGYDQAYAVLVLQDMTDIRRAERMRVDFIANASHELKTPLTSVIGFLETLMGPAKHDMDAADHFMPIMASQADRMKRLVEDLLSLSRIESNEHLVPSDCVDLCAIIQQVQNTVGNDAQERNVTVKIDCASEQGGSANVIGNENDLYRLVLNLVENGIKYGRKDGELMVRVYPEMLHGGPGFCLQVQDDGIGIAAEDIPRLTERFYRVDVKSSRKVGGTGLGLAIVKHIVNNHRGQLAITSELNKGSCFKVLLPAYANEKALPR